MAPLNAELTAKPARQSAGQDARLYGRRDARRRAKHIQRIIAGLRSELKKSRRDGRKQRARDLSRSSVPAGLGLNFSAPSDESLGYTPSPCGPGQAEFHSSCRRTPFNAARSCGDRFRKTEKREATLVFGCR